MINYKIFLKRKLPRRKISAKQIENIKFPKPVFGRPRALSRTKETLERLGFLEEIEKYQKLASRKTLKLIKEEMELFYTAAFLWTLGTFAISYQHVNGNLLLTRAFSWACFIGGMIWQVSCSILFLTQLDKVKKNLPTTLRYFLATFTILFFIYAVQTLLVAAKYSIPILPPI